jgi:hypothetical protein
VPPPVGGWLRWDPDEWERIMESEDGPVGRDLGGKAQTVVQGAKRRAPVSPRGSNGRGSGYLRSNIGWRYGRDSFGLYVVVESTARTPDGKPYALFVEIGTRPHEIRSKGPYPLRNRQTGQVFGRVVQHPGTAAQPYLRPALDDIRGP